MVSQKKKYEVCTLFDLIIHKSFQLIPKEFASANGLFNIKKRDLLVRDERQRSWNVILRSYNNNFVYLKDGWNKIRDANCLKEGDRIMFEVVTNGNKPIWKFYGKFSHLTNLYLFFQTILYTYLLTLMYFLQAKFLKMMTEQ